MHQPDQIWQLIARALNQEASATEREELAAYLREDESLQQQFDLLSRIWAERDTIRGDESEARATVQKIIHRSEEEESEEQDIIRLYDEAIARRRRRRNWLAAASVLLVIAMGAGWLLWNNLAPGVVTGASKEALVAQKGSRTRSMLPDGTTVWLNAGSKLHFLTDFNGASREVQLDGEAYFDVAKKEGKPFIVHTGEIKIKVLGTAFNVKSYPEDRNVETTLFHGRVQVYRQDKDRENAASEPIDLRPNQKLILSRKAATEPQKLSPDLKPPKNTLQDFVIAPIDSTKKEEERFETAWLYSRLEFRGDNFETLSYKLERWYNVNIEFTDESLKQLTFNGSFEKESIVEAFEALQTAVPYFRYKIENNDITVSAPR
ncbi:MAG: FecR domain-containing protein [Chitinophagaceae bacterium]|nr:FecR domain-containing protein [Chitinophagaceae bacterium]